MTSVCKVAVITSRFNQDITQQLKAGALDILKAHAIDILTVDVPGAVEIPIVAQRIAKLKQADVIIALGAVIRGETSHYDYVCDMVSQGCMRVSLDFDIPVIFGVLTTENEAQAYDRLGGKHGHKGKESAECAIEMHKTLLQFNPDIGQTNQRVTS